MPKSLQEFSEQQAEETARLAEIAELRAVNQRLQRALSRSKAKTEELVEATIQAAHDAMVSFGPIAAVPSPARDNRRHSAEVALWHLSDWQGSKVTSSYNSDIMVRRVNRFVDQAELITNVQRADHPVKECVICFGGDMVEGLFNFSSQPFEIDATIFGQYVTVSRLIVDTVRRALALYDKVTVVAEWGNHGRIGSKRAVVPRSDNFDRMCYELARQLLEGESRLTWQDCPEDIQHVEVGKYRALLIHGDEIGRNGFASRNTIVQHANRWRSGAHRGAAWSNGDPAHEFRDVLVGHYHVHGEEGLANGEGSVFWTGSTESDNRYAGITLASSAVPSQRLHFIHPGRGLVTATYKVWLD